MRGIYQTNTSLFRQVPNSLRHIFHMKSQQACWLKPSLACHTYLSSSELVELFPELPHKQSMAYVYRPQRNIIHPRVKLVCEWLMESVAEVLEVKVRSVFKTFFNLAAL